MSIDVAEEGELLVESMSIVLLEVRGEDRPSLFDKKRPLLSVDKLSDIFSSLRSSNKRKPDWFGLARRVCDNLDTLTIVELIVEWYNMSVHLGDSDRVSETRVDGVGEVDRSRSLWESDDISSRGKDKYLIREYIHLHLLHELTSSIFSSHDPLDGLDPVAIFGLLTRTGLTILKMSSNSDLCLDMHIWCTDLDLCRLRSNLRKKSYHRRME